MGRQFCVFGGHTPTASSEKSPVVLEFDVGPRQRKRREAACRYHVCRRSPTASIGDECLEVSRQPGGRLIGSGISPIKVPKMLRVLCVVLAAQLLVTSSARAQASPSVTTNCERNARATKETCTSVYADSTVKTVCVVHRGYWKWQSDKETCTSTTALTTGTASASPVPEPNRVDKNDAFTGRYASLRHDFAYGDTLVRDAAARGDTAAVRRLSADQSTMMVQLLAMSDTAARRRH